MTTLRKMTNINPFTVEYSCMRHRAPAYNLGAPEHLSAEYFPCFDTLLLRFLNNF